MSQNLPPPERPSYLSVLPLFLFRPDGSRLAYVLKAWLLALVPSILLSLIVNSAAPAAEQPHLPLSGPAAIGFITLLGPFLETLIMAGALLVLTRIVAPGPAAVLSAIGWGVAHSWAAPIWGLIIWWPFLIFSILFVTWRSRSLAMAFAMPALAHALHNLPSAILVGYTDLV